jgi:hypothetical protein
MFLSAPLGYSTKSSLSAEKSICIRKKNRNCNRRISIQVRLQSKLINICTVHFLQFYYRYKRKSLSNWSTIFNFAVNTQFDDLVHRGTLETLPNPSGDSKQNTPLSLFWTVIRINYVFRPMVDWGFQRRLYYTVFQINWRTELLQLIWH